MADPYGSDDLWKKYELRGAYPQYFVASATVSTNPGRVTAICVNATTSSGYVQLRDGGSNGTVVWRVNVGNTITSQSINFSPGIRFSTNIYAEISNSQLSIASVP